MCTLEWVICRLDGTPYTTVYINYDRNVSEFVVKQLVCHTQVMHYVRMSRSLA